MKCQPSSKWQSPPFPQQQEWLCLWAEGAVPEHLLLECSFLTTEREQKNYHWSPTPVLVFCDVTNLWIYSGFFPVQLHEEFRLKYKAGRQNSRTQKNNMYRLFLSEKLIWNYMLQCASSSCWWMALASPVWPATNKVKPGTPLALRVLYLLHFALFHNRSSWAGPAGVFSHREMARLSFSLQALPWGGVKEGSEFEC